jgi:uncharacterized protein YjdB
MKKFLNPVVAVAILVLASACQSVDRIDVEPSSFTATEPGQSVTLKPTAMTKDGKPVEGAKFEFSTSDERVATVDATGKVTAGKTGSAVITIKSGEKSAKATVDVSIPATIAVKNAPFNLVGVGTTATLEAQVQDETGKAIPGAKVDFAVADPQIAEVSGTTLTAKSVGATSLKATSGGLEQSFDVSVKLPEVDSIAFEGAPESLKVGESVQLAVAAKAADGKAINGATATFTSSNEKLATVDATGKVTAVKPGAVTITAKSGEKTAETKLTIKKK